MESPDTSKVLYDAGCDLCTGAVDFVRRHAADDRFEFLPLEAPEVQELLPEGERPAGDSLVLLDADGRHERSTAALRIAAGLRPPWSWLRLFTFVPQPIRDRIYDFIARRRHGRNRPDCACGPDSRGPHPGKR